MCLVICEMDWPLTEKKELFFTFNSEKRGLFTFLVELMYQWAISSSSTHFHSVVYLSCVVSELLWGLPCGHPRSSGCEVPCHRKMSYFMLHIWLKFLSRGSVRVYVPFHFIFDVVGRVHLSFEVKSYCFWEFE